MKELEIILWVVGVLVSMNTVIMSAIWRRLERIENKVGQIGEENAVFKVRLTLLERNKHECKFASKGG